MIGVFGFRTINCTAICEGISSLKGSYILPMAALAMLGACARTAEPVDPNEAIAAIQQAEEAQAAALGRNDLDAAVTIFAEDAVLYMQGIPPAVGREAIKAVNRNVLEDPALNVAIDEGSRKWWVSASGDLATTSYTSAWTHTDTSSGKPVTQQLVSQTTWTRQTDGSWKNVLDINSVYPNATGR